MATNTDSTYGVDIACLSDADAFFSRVTGIDLVRQNALHRITTDAVLGDDGSGSFMISGWGFDCRRLPGVDPRALASYQPIIAEALKRDPRIDDAVVVLTATVAANGTADVLIDVQCTTALGPFSIVSAVSSLTTLTLES